MILLGADVYNGTPAQLATFRDATGATYPLLLSAATSTGGNLLTDYGDRDDYAILDQNDIIRFNARLQGYAWGASLDVPRMRALVDSLLANAAGVDDGGPSRPRLDAAPNPFVAATRIVFDPRAAGGALRVEVLDTAGRLVRRLADGPAPAGALRVDWDGRDARGASVRAGVYLVRAASADGVWTERIVRLR